MDSSFMSPYLPDMALRLQDLPDFAVENILSWLSYDEIAKKRVVCKKFNRIGQSLLNRGFYQAERKRAELTRCVKVKLPRRESERRNHRLARHVDVLSSVETRLSMLNMTFMKYIERGACCFIPGRILDEIFYILRAVETNNIPFERSNDFLLEFRDYSSMAMEHFEEHIAPGLGEENPSKMRLLDMEVVGHELLPLYHIPQPIRYELRSIRLDSKSQKSQVSSLKKKVEYLTFKTNKLEQQVRRQTVMLRGGKQKMRLTQYQMRHLRTDMDKITEKYDLMAREFEEIKLKLAEKEAKEKEAEEALKKQKEEEKLSAEKLPSAEEMHRKFLNWQSQMEDFVQKTYKQQMQKYEPLSHSQLNASNNFSFAKTDNMTGSFERQNSNVSLNGSLRNSWSFQLENSGILNSGNDILNRKRKREVVDTIKNVVEAKVPKMQTFNSTKVDKYLNVLSKKLSTASVKNDLAKRSLVSEDFGHPTEPDDFEERFNRLKRRQQQIEHEIFMPKRKST